MFDSLLTNVFGRPKNKSSGRNSQHDPSGTSSDPTSGSAHMTGPFSMSTPQMPQPPGGLYPDSPYPPMNSGPSQDSSQNYPSLLPFSQQPSMPVPYGAPQPYNYPTGTLAASQVTPLDSVPFEAKLTLNNSTSLVSLDQLFRDIKKAAEVVDRADAYLRSNQSDYDFKTEQNLIYQ